MIFSLMIETNPRNRSTGVKGVTWSPKNSKANPFKAHASRTDPRLVNCTLTDRSVYPWGGANLEICLTRSYCESLLLMSAFLENPAYYEQVWWNKPIRAKTGKRGPLTREDFPAVLLETVA